MTIEFRQILRIGTVVIAGLLLSLTASAQDVETHRHSSPSHGTINVLLANGSSLVLVADSMLTAGQTHEPTGLKVYKLDDQTVCSMAGFYSERGPMRGFDALIPNTVAKFAQMDRASSRIAFAAKVRAIIEIVEFELTSHLELVVMADSKVNINDPSLWAVTLTVAGYDTDQSLQVADILL
jgi:hypothetical protein